MIIIVQMNDREMETFVNVRLRSFPTKDKKKTRMRLKNGKTLRPLSALLCSLKHARDWLQGGK